MQEIAACASAHLCVDGADAWAKVVSTAVIEAYGGTERSWSTVELLRHLAERCRAHMFFAVRALSRRAEQSRVDLSLNVQLLLVTMNTRFMCVRFV